MTMQALFQQGCQAMNAGNFALAADLFKRVLSEGGEAPEVWSNLGISLFNLGGRRDSIDCFRRAVALAPGFAHGYNNLGRSLACCGFAEEALAACREAIALDPLFVEAHNNAGTVLAGLGRFGEALQNFSFACEVDPASSQSWYNKAGALKELGQFSKAAAAYRKALELAPNDARSLAGLAIVMQQRGETGQAVELLRQAVAAAPFDRDVHSNLIMTLNYCETATQTDVVEESRLWGALHGGDAGPAPLHDRNGRRIRIGYVSGDLQRHPVSTFLKESLKHHDRNSFEITCYHNSTRCDEVTEELKRYVERWRVIAAMTDAETCDLVRKDEIDILVDLSGHTGGTRLALFGLRLAPVQATWLGYCHSSGLRQMDYLITDPITVPPGEEHLYTERLLRLPHLRFCYAPPAPSPFVDDLPAVANGFVTFGSFNNVAKLTPAVLSLWARVLQAVPASRLVLKWKSFDRAPVRKSFKARFARLGIDPDRIECRGASKHFLALAEYNDIDIALDPFPFNGGMTTCEAMWMGVPVVTLAGATPIGRQSAGFLKVAGLPELIGRSEDEYVGIAAKLAGDLPRLASLREGLRDMMEGSPLCDGPSFAKDLEQLYRVMLQEKEAFSSQPKAEAEQVPAQQEAAQQEVKGENFPLAEESATPSRRCGLPDAAPPRRREAGTRGICFSLVPAPKKTLRIGYLLPKEFEPRKAEAHQGDQAHPVARNREGGAGGICLSATRRISNLANMHDRQAFDLFFYHRGAGAGVFPGNSRDVAGFSDQLLSRLLERDGIDILVDLSGAHKDEHPLAAAVPVVITAAELPESPSIGTLETLSRDRWLSFFLAQQKPRRRAKGAEVSQLIQEGRSLWGAGRLDEAEAKLNQALHLDPRSADALTVLGAVLVYQWRLYDGLACFRRALAMDPRHVKARSSLIFAMNYSDRLTDREIFKESRAWDHVHRAAATGHAATAADTERPLRIGYLSPDFRRHSVNFFFEPLLANHDRGSFRIFCYSCVERGDDATARLQTMAAEWRECAGLDDEEIATLVRQDDIDILVDLAGHSGARIRLPVFAVKPAPIQVSWLGFPNSTGLKAIDYRLTDAWADPEGEGESWYTEKLVRLPEGFLCYLPDGETPEPGPLPMVRNGYVTLGSFNMLPKLTPSTVEAWARVLVQLPNARLLLKCHPLADHCTRERVLQAFAREGVAPERITLSGVVSPEEHLALYREVDLALDPFPYNGTTTTCEALWMGVPVVSLCGNRHAARVGNSILRRLSLGELVAGDRESYIETVVELAQDPERLAQYRRELRGRMAESSLCGGAAFAAQVEAAYQDMWRSWCR